MNITAKIIITDTNIITDLNSANILEEFVNLDNVYISDMVKNDEINSNTGNITSSSSQLIEVSNLSIAEKKLSPYDLLNYVIARDNNGILATGDNRLKRYAESKKIEVIRTLKIIKLMQERGVITCEKAINACHLLKTCRTTRIPEEDINNLIDILEDTSVAV